MVTRASWFGNTTAASPDKTYIGGCRFNGADVGFFHGVIDEVRIYDRALSASEIGSLSGTTGGSTSVELRWLVTDQLGTPRMVFDKTGSFSATKRHDYLPFGEELVATQGLRTSALGYTADLVRQKFTQKERDSETGLDYFGARYYASTQGRFTSADPIMIKKARLLDPQRINRYGYVRNNPLKFIDPDGADLILAEALKPKQREFIVKNLARLYMTEKGRAALERADRSPYNIEVGRGKLERKELSPAKPGEFKIGGTVHVVGGITTYESATDTKTKEKQLAASGPPGLDSLNPIRVAIDKDNSSEMGKDPARVLQHEIGGHVNAVLDLAERPYPETNYPAGNITELDAKKDEENARKVENVGKIPDNPSPEAVKAVEELLKPRKKQPE